MKMRKDTAVQVHPSVEQFDIFVIDWDALPQFTESEFDELRYRLLLAMLSSLKDLRVCDEQKADALEWLKSDDTSPFSFRVCCESEGVDFEVMRDLILDHLRM
ncbi:hypothetical protein ACH518_00090 (plasmid) [Methylomonas sp. HW2-6]|uniref:hypothetical protein n=1 Tax=Methylomonas TaxID=416 RepID=UPI0006CF6506|nr:hypothetical protein [Methylomonas koyamae]BBL60903.1 hypothetical protein MKFW12EY_45160 [Methylomonas koyamae]